MKTLSLARVRIATGIHPTSVHLYTGQHMLQPVIYCSQRVYELNVPMIVIFGAVLMRRSDLFTD